MDKWSPLTQAVFVWVCSFGILVAALAELGTESEWKSANWLLAIAIISSVVSGIYYWHARSV